MRGHVPHRGARRCPGARARGGGATFLRRLARSGSCTVVAMVFGAKGRGGPGTAALVLVLAPACASGVGLDDDSGATQVVVSTGGTSAPPPDTTAKVTVAPTLGAASASVTRTTIGDASAWETKPVCASPLTTVSAAGPALPTSKLVVVSLASPAALATSV